MTCAFESSYIHWLIKHHHVNIFTFPVLASSLIPNFLRFLKTAAIFPGSPVTYVIHKQKLSYSICRIQNDQAQGVFIIYKLAIEDNSRETNFELSKCASFSNKNKFIHETTKYNRIKKLYYFNTKLEHEKSLQLYLRFSDDMLWKNSTKQIYTDHISVARSILALKL